jgi:general secretion pathway protein C
MKRISLILSFVLFIALCVTMSFWVLQFIKPEARKIAAPPATKPVADVESVAGLFGGALAVNANYQLKGIVLANPANQSGAIIAVDGKPTQAYRIDAEISPGVKLSEVHSTYILILDNGVSKRVELPQDFKSPGIADNAAIRAPMLPGNLPANPSNNSNVPGGRGNVDNVLANRNVRLRGLQPIPANPTPKPAGDSPPPPAQENQ